MYRLQETTYKMNEKYTQIESACKAKIPIIKKQIININERIDQQEKRADFIAKRDNSVYIRLWDLHLNNITSCINNVIFTIYIDVLYTIKINFTTPCSF